MKCPNCFKEINETDKYCGFCGYKLNNQSVSVEKPRIECYHQERPVEINRAIILIYATVATGVISLFLVYMFFFR